MFVLNTPTQGEGGAAPPSTHTYWGSAVPPFWLSAVSASLPFLLPPATAFLPNRTLRLTLEMTGSKSKGLEILGKGQDS